MFVQACYVITCYSSTLVSIVLHHCLPILFISITSPHLSYTIIRIFQLSSANYFLLEEHILLTTFSFHMFSFQQILLHLKIILGQFIYFYSFSHHHICFRGVFHGRFRR